MSETILWKHLNELGQIGRETDGSITRFPFTHEDFLAEKKIWQYMEEAALQVFRDAAGNLIGKWEGSAPDEPPVLCGSHYDTVRNGGMFDGTLGLLAGIEAVRLLRQEGFQPRRTILIVGFKDEEGNRFGFGMIGSKSICGMVSAKDLSAKDQNGISLSDAMIQSGLYPEKLKTCILSPIHCMLELHIEQGKVLEENGCSIGIVSGIAGLIRYTITICGTSGHSGATPMHGRKDPVVLMSQWIMHVTKLAASHKNCVATIGSIHTFPGECNIICDHVTFTLDLRSTDEPYLYTVLNEMKQFETENNMTVHYQLEQKLPAALCDENLCQKTEDICKKNHFPFIPCVSGAGHDAMNFRNHCPIGMVFVPSRNGYSHRKEEYTSPEDCQKGMLVLKELLKLESC